MLAFLTVLISGSEIVFSLSFTPWTVTKILLSWISPTLICTWWVELCCLSDLLGARRQLWTSRNMSKRGKTRSESTKVLSTGSLLWQYPVALKDLFSSLPWLVSLRKYQFQLLEALTVMLMESQNKEQLLRVSVIIDLWVKIKARLPCPYFFNNPVLR